MEYDFEKSKFVIFKNAEDDENAHSRVIINETVYDFGEVSTLFQVEQCTITTTDIYGVTLVKITVVLGAAYAPSEYYCIDSSGNDKHPRIALRIENYNNREVDFDSEDMGTIIRLCSSTLYRHSCSHQQVDEILASKLDNAISTK